MLVLQVALALGDAGERGGARGGRRRRHGRAPAPPHRRAARLAHRGAAAAPAGHYCQTVSFKWLQA